MAAMKNYSSMEQREAAAPPSTHSVSTEATVAKMVIINLYTFINFLHGILWRVWRRYSAISSTLSN